MPTISMFFGIIIKMYNTNEHNPPHFHAEYGEYEATFYLNGEHWEGEFPIKKAKMVSVWADIHRDELEANWKLAMAGEQLYRIAPLS
jgi:hypothetical protein